MIKIDLSRPHVGNRVTFGVFDVVEYDAYKKTVAVQIGDQKFILPVDGIANIMPPEARVGDVVKHIGNAMFTHCEVVAKRDGKLIVFSPENGSTISGKPHEFELLERAE
jgi:hypothetical protein